MASRTITVESMTREGAIALARKKFNKLYDDGSVWKAQRISQYPRSRSLWEVSFTDLGNYIGRHVPSDTLEEISEQA